MLFCKKYKTNYCRGFMKRAEVLLILVFTAQVAITQALAYPWQPSSYNARPMLDKFVGTWHWVQATDTFEIKTQKGVFHYAGDLNCDVEQIFGWLRHVKNGVLQLWTRLF
jgi:hypothetical protein